MLGLDELAECQRREWSLFSGQSERAPKQGQCVQSHAMETRL